MNFNNHSRFFFKSAFKNANNSSRTNFFSGKSFRSFFTYNMQKNIGFLSHNYSNSNGIMLLNNISIKNYITISNSYSIKNSIGFLSNDSTSNGDICQAGQKINSEVFALMEEILKLEDGLLDNGM